MRRYGGIGRWLSLRPRGERLRDTLWFTPLLIVVACYLFAAMIEVIDQLLSAFGISQLINRVWEVVQDREAAKSVLSVQTGALITTITLLLSLTLVAVQLASSQLGPRLIADFLRNRVVQVTIGLYLGTWVMGNRMNSAIARGSELPLLGVLITQLMVGACLILLIFFVQAVLSEVRIPVVLPRLVREADEDLRNRRAQPYESATSAGLEREPRGDTVVHARRAGYLGGIDVRKVVRWATRRNALVTVVATPGTFIPHGERIAVVTGPMSDLGRLDRWMELTPIRLMRDDPTSSVERLTEIALRALSPAINDTYTGLACLNWLGEVLRLMAARPGSADAHTDHTGEVRLVVHRKPVAAVAERALGMIRVAGAGNPAVLERIVEVIEPLVRLAPPDLTEALLAEARRAAEDIRATHQLKERVQRLERDYR